MWKKPEGEKLMATNDKVEAPAARPAPAPTPSRPMTQATLGSSLTVEGTITGAEDLVIEGAVKGTVDLKNNTVTVGRSGRIEGDVYAQDITIEGEVLGNVFAGERASIHKSGYVKGNVVSPRVVVEDGARLKGSIDVDCVESSKKTETKIFTSDAQKKEKEKEKENGATTSFM